jgi:hypothetical protein
MSDKQDEANQRAFRKGQDAWRDNKDIERDNPYPPDSPYHKFWRQGWEQEDGIQKK